MGLELGLYIFVSLVCFGGLADCPYGHLSAESVLPSDSVVDDFLEPDFVSRLVVECNVGDVVAGFVEPLHSLKKGTVLFWCWSQLHEECKFHLQ
jgi:hypothetical protein